ncbi:MAG: GNAT family N-acetyltransferase [Acholeplasmatales bacterium]|nr:MAG: GNAT family N-acetyltransferase [Acholeplasmatales bacterium]
MNLDNTIEVLNENQRQTLLPILRKSFGLFGYFMAFDVGDYTLVYKEEETILGGIVCGTINLQEGRKLGMIKYLFTHPDAQGRGIAGRLFAAAMDHFENAGYAEVAGCVEGHNTASSNLFAQHGFALRSTADQYHRYQKALPKVWFKGNHLVDIGYFWWSKALQDTMPATPDDRHAKPLGAWWVQVLFHAVLIVLLMLRQGWRLHVHIIWLAPVIAALLFALKFGPMLLAARRLKFKVVYRYWESGMILATAITLFFSGVFVTFGGLYPNKAVWREDHEKQTLFKMTLPSVLVLLTASAVAVFLFPLYRPNNPRLIELMGLFRFIIPYAIFFDLLLGIAPANAMGGGRIRRVNPVLWAVLLAISAVLMVVQFIT